MNAARSRRHDAVFLVVVMTLSVLPYIGRLGFYSDDWAFLGSLVTVGDHSAIGDPAVVDWAAYLRPRPLQVAYQEALFRAFGLWPLGYHVVNSAVLVAAVVLCYLALREAGVARVVAVAGPLVWGLLPTYASDRFWFAAFGYPLAMAAGAASVWADLRGLRAHATTRWAWKAATTAAWLVSGLGYEVALPLLAGHVAGLAWGAARGRGPAAALRRWPRPAAWCWVGLPTALLVGVIFFKMLAGADSADRPTDLTLHAIRVVGGSLWTSTLTFGVGLPLAARWSFGTLGGAGLAASAALGLLVAGYLYRMLAVHGDFLPGADTAGRVAVAGAAVFTACAVLFLATGRYLNTATGVSNRTAIGPALGAALVMVAAALWIAGLLPRGRKAAFVLVVAGVCMLATMVTGGLGALWGESWRTQQSVLTAVGRDLPDPLSGTTVLLDNVCPFSGPAPVFESSWDTTGALQTRYRDLGLTGDVTSANLQITPRGLETVVYGSIRVTYPYRPRLVVYDPARGVSHRLPDRTAARRWSRQRSLSPCPHGALGRGVPMLSLDRRLLRFEDEFLWP
ncbi:MAG: hypothetical protein M3524_06915 [Actinomycetota bacterium]|nr:hypothetical protein [Actinomycetota bacterium]